MKLILTRASLFSYVMVAAIVLNVVFAHLVLQMSFHPADLAGVTAPVAASPEDDEHYENTGLHQFLSYMAGSWYLLSFEILPLPGVRD